MTEQIEAYLREQFTADAERAPHAHDLADTARARVRRQRRRTAGAVAAGLAVLVLVAGVTFGLDDSTRAAVPPAKVSTASPSPTASPASETQDAPAVLNAWLENPNEYTADAAAVAWGGRIYCETVIVSTSASGDDLYVWALCAQVYAKDGTATVGSGQSGPLVMHVRHRVDAGGTLVVTGVNGIDYPRPQTFNEDIDRLFPSDIVDLMHSGELDVEPMEADLLARAQADVDAGRLGAFTEPGAIAARFLAYARGQADSISVDTPVRLYLGNQYKKTIRPMSDGRRSWDVCTPGYAERSCPMSAVGVLRGFEYMPTITPAASDACFAAAGSQPTDTGGSAMVALAPLNPVSCLDDYAVQIWSNDVGQITAVNLLLGSP